MTTRDIHRKAPTQAVLLLAATVELAVLPSMTVPVAVTLFADPTVHYLLSNNFSLCHRRADVGCPPPSFQPLHHDGRADATTWSASALFSDSADLLLHGSSPETGSFNAPRHDRGAGDEITAEPSRPAAPGMLTQPRSHGPPDDTRGRRFDSPSRARPGRKCYATEDVRSIPSRPTPSRIEPVSAFPLSPRRAVTAAATLSGSERGSPGTVGVQVACQSPLVPRPTSPRSPTESHPW